MSGSGYPESAALEPSRWRLTVVPGRAPGESVLSSSPWGGCRKGQRERNLCAIGTGLNSAYPKLSPELLSLLAVPIKFSEKQQASHYLYVRQHRVREGTQSAWPPNRTLFILNVPPYCTEVRAWQGTSRF